MPEQETKSVDIRSFVKAIWRRKWLLVIPVVVATAAGTAISMTLSPVYEAKSTIVTRMQERLSEPLARIIGRSPIEEQLTRLQERVKSRAFLVELVRTLGLAESPGLVAWAEEARADNPNLTVEDLAEQKAVDGLQRRISVSRSRTDAFYIIVRDTDADRAMLLAQHITNAIVSASNREQLEDIRAVHDFSIEQLVIYKQKLTDAERRLREYQETRVSNGIGENPISETNVHRADILISQASIEKGQAIEELADRRTALQRVAGGDYSILAELQSTELTGTADQLVQYEREVASVLVRTTGQGAELTTLYVGVADLKGELRDEARSLVTQTLPGAGTAVREAFAQYKAAEVEARMIEERHRVLNQYMWNYTRGRASAAGEALEIDRLEQEVESNRALYETFLQQTAAGQITEALEAAQAGGRFEIIEPPIRPSAPVAPDKLMIMVLSLFGGLVVGLAAVLVSEQSDTSLKDIEDIQRILGVPVLATVPSADIFRTIASLEKQARRSGQQSTDGNSALVSHMVRETAVSFEFRRLARKLAQGASCVIPKSIMVTSANRGEGKTSAAACLAITLAKHYGKRTVLVDCDLRKPRIHQIMAVASRPGLADALERGNLLGTDIKPTALPNLFVLPCGTRRKQPTWLLESFPGSRVMTELLASFDHVIFDTAPNLPVPDAMIMGGAVEGVVMVMKAGVTPREVAMRGVQLQMEEKGNVLGVVVNNLERVLPYYYDYRYYGYTTDTCELEEE